MRSSYEELVASAGGVTSHADPRHLTFRMKPNEIKKKDYVCVLVKSTTENTLAAQRYCNPHSLLNKSNSMLFCTCDINVIWLQYCVGGSHGSVRCLLSLTNLKLTKSLFLQLLVLRLPSCITPF